MKTKGGEKKTRGEEQSKESEFLYKHIMKTLKQTHSFSPSSLLLYSDAYNTWGLCFIVYICSDHIVLKIKSL